MATSTSGISVGDAVFSLLVDLTSLDTLENRLQQLPPKFKPSGDAALQLASNLGVAGTAGTEAVKKIDQVATTSKLPALGTEAKDVGEKLQAAGQQATVTGTQIANSTQAPTTRIKALQSEVVTLRQQLAETGQESATAFSSGDEAVAQLQERIASLEAEISVLNLKIVEMGEEFNNAGHRAAGGLAEAKGEIALLGEATGVVLPRHVRGFVASLPGVATALSAAFEATAVFFLIDALIQGTEKLTEFIATTFIFTEAMKKSDAITAAMNAELVKNADQTKKLKDEYALLGLDGVAKTGAQMQLLQKDIQSNNTALEQAREKVANLNKEFGDRSGHEEEFAAADAAFLEANAKRIALEQQRTNLSKEAGLQRNADAQKAALAELDIEKDRQTSIVLLKQQENLALAAEENAGNAALSAIEARHQLDLYNIELGALLQKRALLASDKTSDPNLVQQVNAQIENLQRDHASALIKIYADTIQGINSLSLGDTGRADIGSKLLGTDFKDRFAQAEEAAQQLGITLSGTLAENVDKARDAFDQLKASGVASTEDLLAAQTQLTIAQVNNARAAADNAKETRNLIQAQEQQINAAIAADEATGKDTTNLQRMLVVLQQLDGRFRRGRPTFETFFRDLAAGSLHAGQAIKQLGQLTAEGIGASVTAAVNGSQSFSEAMLQLVKSTLASLAGVAVGHVLTEIAKAASDFATAASLAADPFTAALAPGFIAAAHTHLVAAAEWGAIGAGAAIGGAAIPGGGSGSTSSNGSAGSGADAGGGQVSPTQTAPQPVQTVNVQRLARGGVTDKQQLAWIGDREGGGDATEAIIPLDDDRATGRIAAAILKPLQFRVGLLSAGTIAAVGSQAIGPAQTQPGSSAEHSRRLDAMAESIDRLGEARVGDVYVTVQVDGIISQDHMKKVARDLTKIINRSVSNGNLRVNASNSQRVTKRG